MGPAPLPPDLRDELDTVFLSLEGLQRARCLAIASLCCVLYDFALTLDQEVAYFWTGRWTLSRVLFFVNRYFPVAVLVNTLIAIIVLRICYVYSKNPIARGIVVGTFVTSVVSTCVLFRTIWHDVEAVPVNVPGLKITSCTAPPSKTVWRMFVPNLILHTVLYLATTIPALRMRRLGKKSMLMDRLVMDGGIFFSVVFVAAMFSAIGSLARTPLVTIPAIYSNVLLALSCISVSRLMLSIRSLAASLSLQPDWLLNNTELNRVNWKHGPRDGELIVEVDAFEDEDVEMDDTDSPSYERPEHAPVVHVSRVGVLENAVYPGTSDFKSPPRVKRQKIVLS
ncbi:hypothetical protein LXA43DRAFT_897234 [Ganoderma leucocontextum]|nr:hypothetical protein LXA43DRAFT_897234 [Ganoderma leucocontextum]